MPREPKLQFRKSSPAPLRGTSALEESPKVSNYHRVTTINRKKQEKCFRKGTLRRKTLQEIELVPPSHLSIHQINTDHLDVEGWIDKVGVRLTTSTSQSSSEDSMKVE